MAFYKLDIPAFTQYKYAWAQTSDDAKVSDHCHKCPLCGNPVSMLIVEPPFEIEISQSELIGDFVNGIIPCDIIVSEKFKNAYEQSDLTGFKQFSKLQVVKVGSEDIKVYDGPDLYCGFVIRPLTQVDYKKMKIEWDDQPAKNYCKLCGPGGGGKNGIIKSCHGIFIRESTWTGSDFFIPINFSGNLFITEKAVNFLKSNKFENYTAVKDADVKYDYYNA